MLDVTIYKVSHGGINEKETMEHARKLIPYVKNSDVFSLEISVYSEEEAAAFSRFWNKVLENPGSTREGVRKMMEKDPNTPHYSLHRLYTFTLVDYFFRNNVGIWFAEQFPTALEARKTNLEIHLALNNLFSSTRALERKQIGSEEKYYESNKFLRKIANYRDYIIGNVAKKAEPLIREIYPRLRDKEVIRWGIPIGSVHAPEKYIPDAKVIDLAGQLSGYDALCFEVERKMEAGASFEEVRDLIREIGNFNSRTSATQ